MRARSQVLACLALGGLLGAAACRDRDPVNPLANGCVQGFDFAAQRVRDITFELQVPGAAFLLLRNGGTVCEMYLGEYDADTRVRLMSAAKWMTAVTIMTAVDAGELSLDTKAADLIPSFASKGGITLRQLLSHTSGLPPEALCPGNQLLTLGACADSIGLAPTEFPPGQYFSYGGASFTVAGRMAEIATGKSWNTLFAERIAAPLGLNGTGYVSAQNPILAEGLAEATLRDYGNMLQMLLDGGVARGKRVMSEANVAAMFADQTAAAALLYSPRGDMGYGLGVWREMTSAGGGAMRVGSPGISGVIPWIDLDLGVVGVFMTSTPFADVHDMVDVLKQEVRTVVIPGSGGSGRSGVSYPGATTRQ